MSIFFHEDAFANGTWAWASVVLMSWTIVEASSLVLAACLPALSPLLAAKWTGRQSMASMANTIKSLFALSSASSSRSPRGASARTDGLPHHGNSSSRTKGTWNELADSTSTEHAVLVHHARDAQVWEDLRRATGHRTTTDPLR
ncbi:MAG: hypothetical protein M1826_005392 [Phylliscum demangeonii]|nr:MAG: hypothetical protein M1826_005392 [Phylliscum demangeonii]